jgi:hypothetical protein
MSDEHKAARQRLADALDRLADSLEGAGDLQVKASFLSVWQEAQEPITRASEILKAIPIERRPVWVTKAAVLFTRHVDAAHRTLDAERLQMAREVAELILRDGNAPMVEGARN